MAQPNVAREPSMDEILASIRRIIENNEAQPDPAETEGRATGFHIATGTEDDLLDDPVVVGEFHAEERRPAIEIQPEPRPEPMQGGQPALSLADVAARVRAASERHVSAREQGSGRENAESAPSVFEAVRLQGREDNPVVTARMAPAAGRTADEAEVDTAKVEPTEEPKATVEPASAEAAPAGRDVAALVSPAVGERVAQSFGALAQAVDAGPRRSFDEIAEEMLRPMLQEWLDDNLPTLVERLVREEIERVARGPRR